MFKWNDSRASLQPFFDEIGVTAYLNEKPIQIKYSEITAIYAYKRDCFTMDQIRLVISNGELNIELTEDGANLEALNMYFERHLRVRPDWYQELITSSAFKTNFTVVYSVEQAMRNEATT
jgi:hypothetical protein